MTKHALPDLNQLADTYDIVGELAGRDDARMYLARKRADGLDVLVVTANAPAGDEGNALSHLAADANLLTSLRHRSVLPVVEGRWVGPETFALVLQRTNAPTLAELLNRRDEEFEYARIAAILGEVNGVLEWARAHKVVHRAVRPETLFVEPGTDHVHVSFTVAPLPASGMPGPETDGVTIASLARAMLTRSPAAPERATQPLAELRPGLPVALIEETDRLLNPSAAAEGPPRDVTGYIARVAMAEALKSAEEHLEATRNAIQRQEEEHRAQIEKERREHDQQIATERQQHTEQIANERKQHDREMEAARKAHETLVAEQAKQLQKERELHVKDVTEQQRKFEKQVADQQKQFEKQVADQQKAFERQVAEQQKQLQREREEHQRLVAQQTKQFASERAQFERELLRQRQTLEKERAALAQERAAHARDKAALIEERSRHERITREERDKMAAEAAALSAQADMYARTSENPVVTNNGSDVEVAFPRHLEKSEPPEPPAPASGVTNTATTPPPAPTPAPRAWMPRATPVAAVPAIPMGEITRKNREPEKTTPKRDQQKSEIVRPAEQGPSFHERVIAPTAAWLAGLWSRRPHWSGAPRWRSSWNVPAAAIALVLLIGVTAVALSGGGDRRAKAVATTASPAPSARIVDSASGNVYESVVPLPKVEADTSALAARATDWTPPPRKRVAPPPEPRPTVSERPDTQTTATQRAVGTEADGLPAPGMPMPFAVDTLPRPTGAGLTVPTPRPAVRRDSAARDTVRSLPLPFQIPAPAAKKDSVPKVDTTAKRDSL